MTLAKIAKVAKVGKEISGPDRKFFLAILAIFARESSSIHALG
jgi:hypothetical protein